MCAWHRKLDYAKFLQPKYLPAKISQSTVVEAEVHRILIPYCVIREEILCTTASQIEFTHLQLHHVINQALYYS